MDRRSFLKTAAGAGALTATGGLSMPAISQRAAARMLRCAQADLANFDPIWGTQYVVRNAAAAGVGHALRRRRRSCSRSGRWWRPRRVSPDGLAWTFRLRPGLKFHDGEPVLAKDVVASLSRWAVRDPMGQMIKAIQKELTAVDDRTFKWVLKKPYPKMLLALGQEQYAVLLSSCRSESPRPIRSSRSPNMSAAARCVSCKDEWVPGAKAVFEKFADYVPRQEPASWLAGGKQIARGPHRMDRDARSGDGRRPRCRTARSTGGRIRSPTWCRCCARTATSRWISPTRSGISAASAMNHLYPPFNDVRARRAILMAMSQEDYMRAVVGDDTSAVEADAGLFHARHAALHRGGRRNPQRTAQSRCRQETARRKRLFGRAGHLLGGAGSADHQGAGRRDRRSSQAHRHECRFRRRSTGARSARAGRRNRRRARAAGKCSTPGTPAPTASVRRPIMHSRQRRRGLVWLAEQPRSRSRNRRLVRRRKASMRKRRRSAASTRPHSTIVVYAPTGFFLSYQAWRKNVSGIVKGPLPFFWGVAKTV